MIKLFRSSAALASLALVVLVGAASPVRAGSVGTIANKTIDPFHDLFATLSTHTFGPDGSIANQIDFDFEGTTLGGTFKLVGDYNTLAGTVDTTSFSASGTDTSSATVSYTGTISVLDPTLNVGSDPQLYFSITAPTGPGILVQVDRGSNAADVSPSPVPLPSAVASGALLLALVGAGGFIRWRFARWT